MPGPERVPKDLGLLSTSSPPMVEMAKHKEASIQSAKMQSVKSEYTHKYSYRVGISYPYRLA